MTKRIFITNGPRAVTDTVPHGDGSNLFDPKFFIPCGPGLVCNPWLSFDDYNTPIGFNMSLARIALSDCLYTYFATSDPDVSSRMLEIGFALGQDKPVYIGANFDLAKYGGCWSTIAIKIFMGSAQECWAQIVKEVSQ